MLECSYHERHAHLPLDGKEDTTLTMTVRNKFMRGALASLKSSGVTLFYRSEITVRTTELGNLNSMGIFESKIARAKWQNLVAKGKAGMVTVMESGIKAVIKKSLTCNSLWCWLIAH